MPYVVFIGTGMVCQSAMFTASFEGMYSAFSRMHVQRTWEGIINAPIGLDDVVLAEWRIAARHRASGRRVAWWGMSTCTIRDGLITRWREYWNPQDLT